ncbi:FIST C-terminal domain-containing protein [Paraglaciecola sp.]|uniref:FIST signal transduction protein n=1 Tax=Paraglaciecola sp. TaxID=1920173 RepID=UPI003265874D
MGCLFGQYQYSAIVSGESLQSLLSAALSNSPHALLIFCCDESLKNHTFLDPILTSLQVPVFGGVFPAIILEGKVFEKGIIVLPIMTPVEVKVFENLKNAPTSTFDLTNELPNSESAIVLIDGLSRNIDFALNLIFEHYGKKLKVFGGGAGSLSFEQNPCLFSNQGLLTDAMLVAFMQIPWDLAVGHGWEVLQGPFLANEVDDNKIIQLNFQPALEVYENVIKDFENKLFAEHDFFELAKIYPFGIQRLDDDILVRDPVSVEQTSLLCVGKVPENTMLYILKGQNSNLVKAAVDSVESSITTNFNGQGLLFNCVSRQLFLENEFESELQGIASAMGNSELIGALVLGEVASGESGAIHFHNKTAITATTKTFPILTKELD